MRKITPELTTELLNHFKDPNRIGAAEPFRVNTFRALVEHTAKLSYTNKDHLLFYRGQRSDYKNKVGASSFYPSIYRGEYLQIRDLTNKFDILKGASNALVELFEAEKIEGYKDLKRRQSIQWSILQHYEVCDTPLLDFTQSLRVACSFAMMENTNNTAYIYVFGLPYLSNRISVNSEHDIINIRLLSICPPNALRPYFQEGYLVGTDDITTNYESKTELDFNNRLIAKFEIPNDQNFWGEWFDMIPEISLYPDNDPIQLLCEGIKDFAQKELKAGDIGEFLQSWTELEEWLINTSKQFTLRNLSIAEAIRDLFDRRIIDKDELYSLNSLRTFRNKLVHAPKDIDPYSVVDYSGSLKAILSSLKLKKI